MNENHPPPCPSAAQLRDFAVGAVAGADVDRIADHVLACESCERALRSLDGLTDGLLQSLNGFGPDAPPSDPLPVALLQVAQSAGRSAGETCPDVSLDSGRRVARMLGEGSCRLGRFQLEAELGVGSFGHVFRARDVELNRP